MAPVFVWEVDVEVDVESNDVYFVAKTAREPLEQTSNTMFLLLKVSLSQEVADESTGIFSGRIHSVKFDTHVHIRVIQMSIVLENYYLKFLTFEVK